MIAASGHFVTLEGGEGTGKTTQSALLAEALAARGLTVVRTREPGGSPGAELLRDILLRGDVDWAARPRRCCISPRGRNMCTRRSCRRWLTAAG